MGVRIFVGQEAGSDEHWPYKHAFLYDSTSGTPIFTEIFCDDEETQTTAEEMAQRFLDWSSIAHSVDDLRSLDTQAQYELCSLWISLGRPATQPEGESGQCKN